jgi:regulator of replication initiation timing
MVFSRYDILNSYKSLAGKTLDTMKNGLKSIRILNFLVERLEEEKLNERLEEEKPQKANARKRKRVKAKEEAKEAKNNEEALPPRAKGTRKTSRPDQPSSKRRRRVGDAEPASPTSATQTKGK